MALSTTTKFKNWHLKALRFSPNQLNIPNAQHPMVVLFMANRPLVSNAKKMKALKVQSQLYPAKISILKVQAQILNLTASLLYLKENIAVTAEQIVLK
jgi:hypothetical protein